MGCCQSCRRKKARPPVNEPGNFMYPDIPEVEAHTPFTEIKEEPSSCDDCIRSSPVPPAPNGHLQDMTPINNLSFVIRRTPGSTLSLSKRLSMAGNFYRLSRYGSQFSVADSLKTDGSTWTITSSTYEQKEVDDPNYAANVLHKLNQFRLEDKFTDFTVFVGSVRFRCHKVVLAATSRFFAHSLADEVTEEGDRIVKDELIIDAVEPFIVRLLLDYIYSAKLTISNENATKLLAASRQFHMHSAEQACLEFLERQDNRKRESASDLTKLAAEYTFEQPYHVNEILLGLNDQRHDRKFVDVRLCVEKEELLCHRVVIATIDDVMEKRMVHTVDSGKVTIEDVTPSVLRMIVNYTYTSRLEIFEENAKEALRLASMMKHSSAIRKCSDFLRGMLDPANCLEIQRTASMDLSCEQLHKAATKYALKCFPEVIKQDQYLHLSAEEVLDYLGDDNLNLRSEEEAFEALMKWVRFKEDERVGYLADMLMCIRLPYIGPDTLRERIKTAPLIRDNEGCQFLILEAMEMQQIIREGRNTTDPRMKPRRAFADVTFVVGGRNKQQTWIKDTCYYDSARRKWYPLAPYPGSTTEYRVVAMNNDVYVVGGRNESSRLITGETWKYNSLFDEWSQCSGLVIPRLCHGLGVLHDRIYAVGGRLDSSNEPLHEVERYNRRTNQWKQTESLAYGVVDPVVTAHSRRLYVIGGHTEDTNDILVQCFHLDKSCWTVIKDVSLPCEPRVGATLKSKIYLVGGRTEYRVQVYSPHKGEVNTIAEMQHAEGHARELYSMTVTNKKIDVIGGQWTVGDEDDALTISTNSVEQFDPQTNEWTVLGPMPRALTHHGCVTIKKYIGLPKALLSWVPKTASNHSR
ncbi:kelch-like protein 38 [Diadema setosum]|uniref:kelch-like protein 38 n=1 Tax=Diadema setosum TaxID=31175 RepID=UPI003B3A1DE8